MESCSECQTAPHPFDLPQDSPLQLQEPSPTAGWAVATLSEEHMLLSAGHRGTQDQKHLPLRTGRWFYQAQLLRCPFSVGFVLGLGKSVSYPPKGYTSLPGMQPCNLGEETPRLIT